MPDKEWLTTEEIAAMLGVTRQNIYTAVSALRRTTGIRTTTDPTNYRIVLIHRDDIDAIKKFLRIDGTGNATA